MKLNEEHKALFDTVKNFAINEIKPYTEEWEKEEKIPLHELFKKMGDLDLLGIPYRITIGERTLSDGKVDMQARASEIPLIPIEDEMKLKVNQICDQILKMGK